MIDIWLALCGIEGNLFECEKVIDRDFEDLRYKFTNIVLSENSKLSGAFSEAEQFIFDQIGSVGFTFRLLNERIEEYLKSTNIIERDLGNILERNVKRKYLEFLIECENDSFLDGILTIYKKLEPWKVEFVNILEFNWRDYALGGTFKFNYFNIEELKSSIMKWLKGIIFNDFTIME